MDQELLLAAKQIIEMGFKEKNPNYLGSGEYCDAYWFEYQKKCLVAKKYHERANFMDLNSTKINYEQYLLAKDVLFIPSLIEYSEEDKIIITEFIAGINLATMSDCICENGEINLENLLKNVIDLFVNLDNQGLRCDHKKDNLILKDGEIYIVDFSRKQKDINIGREILIIPILLASDKDCLLNLIPIFLNILGNYSELKRNATTLITQKMGYLEESMPFALHRHKLSRLELSEQDGILSDYIQFDYYQDWNGV